MLKKPVYLLLSSLIIFLSFSVSEAKNFPTNLKAISNNDVLTVGVYDANYPPFFMKDKSGVLVGSDITLAKAIAKKLGVKIQFINTYQTYDAVVSGVASGQVDLGISQITINPVRAKIANFTKPYTVMRQGLLFDDKVSALSNSNQTAIIKQFNNKASKIGLIEGCAYVNYAKKYFPKATIVTFPYWSEVVNAVLAGKINTAYYDEVGIKEYLSAHPDLNSKLKTFYFSDNLDSRGIVVSKNNPQLLQWLNSYLAHNYETLKISDEKQ